MTVKSDVLCECGCGERVSISSRDKPKYGYVKGQPVRFVHSHSSRGRPAKHYARRRTADGLKRIHRLRAEKALGKPLPPNSCVHHADGSRAPTAPLVICENNAYHCLLHQRMRVVRAGGNPNTDRICCHCKRVLALTHFCRRGDGRFSGIHNQCRDCTNSRGRDRYARRVARSQLLEA